VAVLHSSYTLLVPLMLLPVLVIFPWSLLHTMHAPSRTPSQVIFRQGVDGNDLFLIRTGYVRLLRDVTIGDKDRQKINGMTAEMGSLQETMDILASPRRRLPKIHRQPVRVITHTHTPVSG
jgi:hypothetical protein